MIRTVAILLYCAAALGGLGFLVYWEVWGKTSEGRRARLQARVKRECRKMEKTKQRLLGIALPPSTAPNRIPDPIVRGIINHSTKGKSCKSL